VKHSRHYVPLVGFLAVVAVAAGCGEPPPEGYSRRDFVVFSAEGFDLYRHESHPALFPDTPAPAPGTLSECAAACDAVDECAGFSRRKDAPPDEVSECFFKFGLPESARVVGDDQWETFEKDKGPIGAPTEPLPAG
jgi:hypothetical protein